MQIEEAQAFGMTSMSMKAEENCPVVYLVGADCVRKTKFIGVPLHLVISIGTINSLPSKHYKLAKSSSENGEQSP